MESYYFAVLAAKRSFGACAVEGNIMNVYEVDPLIDGRWEALLLRHPHASVFHTPEWLGALKATYGFTPTAYTTSEPGQPLHNGIVFCKVNSWATGARLVSVPFSDHCDPIVDDIDDLQCILRSLAQLQRAGGFRYVELRPLHEVCGQSSRFVQSQEYVSHRVDLRPATEELFRNLHASERKRIRRAERSGVVIVDATDMVSLRRFYGLVLSTRQRHSVPPQPFAWYQNIVKRMGQNTTVLLAYVNGVAVAGTLTLKFKTSTVCKYTGSKRDFLNLGVVQALYWKAIRDAKEKGCINFDWGRTDLSNQGLIDFKRHWGSVETPLKYWRCTSDSKTNLGPWYFEIAKRIALHMPEPLLKASGSILYRHIA